VVSLALAGCSSGTTPSAAPPVANNTETNLNTTVTNTVAPAPTATTAPAPVTTGWTQAERTDFIDGCHSTAGNSAEAAAYCECALGKVEAAYPDTSGMANAVESELQALVASCNSSTTGSAIPGPNSSWTDPELKQQFMTECDSDWGTDISAAQGTAICECAWGELANKFETPDHLNTATNLEAQLGSIVLQCMASVVQ
jgi:hypothetical protein